MAAFTRDEAAGTYSADFERMQTANDALAEKILRFQGDGDYAGVAEFVAKYGHVGAELQRDLDRLADAGIPVDIVFEQGYSILGASSD